MKKHMLYGCWHLKPLPLALRVRSLTTPPVRYLCPFAIFVLIILYQYGFKMSIWYPKRIQMKTFSTTKFYNVLRSTTLVFIISSSEAI